MDKNLTMDSMKLKIKKGVNKGLTFFGVPANSILVIFGIILLILTFIPLIYILMDCFTVHLMEIGLAGSSVGEFTWYHFYEVFASETAVANFYRPLGNSLAVSVLSCVFAVLFGGTVAYLVTRTNMPFKKFISAVFIFPYIMPQWTLALFWKNFFISTNCTGGYVGELQALTGWASPEWLVYGTFPISLVLGLHYAPFAYILIGGILRNMDANLEEAATILNVPRHKIFTHITIPILKPAILSTILLVFSSAMSSYPVATTLGKPINYQVLATIMYSMLQGGRYSRQAGMGAIISMILILIGVIILIMNTVSTGSRKQYTTVSGKSGQISKQNLGKVGKWIVAAILSIIVAVLIIGSVYTFKIQKPVYQSSAEVMVSASSSDIEGQNYSLASYLTNTFVAYFKSDLVLDEVVNKLNEQNITVTTGELKNNLDISIVNDSLILELDYTSPSINNSKIILNTIIDTAIEITNKENISELLKDKIMVFSYGKDGQRVSKTMMNLALSLVIGVVIAFLYVLIKNAFDDTFKSKKDIEVVLNIPVIASIPHYEVKETKENESKK